VSQGHYDQLDLQGPDEIDADLLEDDSPTIRCPNCAAEIYEDADRCNVCGHWLTRRSETSAGLSWWLVLVLAGMILVLILVLF